MAKFKDLTGQRFGRLTVVKRVENKGKHICWLCKCDCGKEKIVRSSDLKKIKSCGCYNKEITSQRAKEMWQDEEYKEQHSKRMKELWQNEEYQNRMSELMKQQRKEWEQDEKYKQMQSDKMKKQWQNDEFRQMQSDKTKEQWQDEEFRNKMSNTMKETNVKLWMNEEFRQMQSDKTKEQNKILWQNDEFRQMHIELSKKQWLDEEYRQMMIDNTKQRWTNDEEYRNKMSEQRAKMNKEMWQNEEYRKAHSGENHPFYNPELTDEDRQNRRIDEKYKNWSKQVKEQANWTCDICGQHGYMEAHHLNDWHSNKEQRYDLENGVCLCEHCHNEFHNYMGGTRIKCTEQDYEEFKKNKTRV